MNNVLPSCPFCNGKAYYYTFKVETGDTVIFSGEDCTLNYIGKEIHVIECSNAGCMAYVESDTKDGVIAKWCRRGGIEATDTYIDPGLENMEDEDASDCNFGCSL